jgi:hypothetical protein
MGGAICGRCVLRQTVSTHVFRIPRSAGAFLVCIDGTRQSSWVRNEERQGKYAQYGYARLNQRAVLHAEEPISEQVTFGLSAAATATKERGHGRIKNTRPHAKGTHLEPAQTLTELLAELHVHPPLTHDVLA